MYDAARVLRDMSGPQAEQGGSSSPPLAPRADLWEENQAYHLELDLPGIPADQVDIALEHGVLSIRAERRRMEQGAARRLERAFGCYSRSFRFPDGIEPDAVDARLCDGVLHVTIPKRPEVQPRTIQVRSAQADGSVLAVDAERTERAA